MYYYSCPGCNNNTRFYKVRRESGTGNTGLGILLFGGVLASLLFLSYRRRTQVQCAHCGFVFYRPSVGRSPVATTAMVLLYCMLLAVIFGAIVEKYPEPYSKLPGWRYVLATRDFVSKHPLGIAAAYLAGLTSMFVLAVLTALIGNFRHSRRIRAAYDFQPTEFPPQPAPAIEEPTIPERCPKCDYNLTGNLSGTCPECGSVFADGLENPQQ